MGCSFIKKIVEPKLSDLPLHYVSSEPKVYHLAGKLGRDNPTMFRFDDTEILIGKEVIHIDSLTFIYSSYITGFSVFFNINGKRIIQKNHANIGGDNAIQTIVFQETEHIIELITTWCKEGVNSITGKTNFGQIFTVEGFEGFGSSSRVEKFLKKNGEVVVGFQGFINEYLQSLYVVCMKPITANFPMLIEISPDLTPPNEHDDTRRNDEDEEVMF